MYNAGDCIVYGTNGVCRVVEVGAPKLSHVAEGRQYYTLEPVYGTEVIYVPVDTDAFMRPAMTREQAEELIARIPDIQEDTVDIRNLQLLTAHYQASFQSHDNDDLVHLIKTLYARGARAEERGKKPSTVDARYLKRAEELLHGELAVALDIPRESVADYIRDQISRQEAAKA